MQKRRRSADSALRRSPLRHAPRKSPLALLALLLGAFLAPGAGTARELDTQCTGEVCIQPLEEGTTVGFDTINNSAAPITVHIRFPGLRNLTPYPAMPPAHVVPAGSYARVAQFAIANPLARYGFRYEWSWVIGDARARHDDGYRYRIPFGGHESRPVTQGYDGGFSHTGAHRYAIDFGVPIGTPVLAARSGVVIRVTDGHTKAGIRDDFLTKANAVLILHEDGTVATYAHLDPGSGVREGMRVRTGEVVGFSGNTGFSSGPHLHFEIWKTDWNGDVTTLPVRFHERERGDVALREGLAYAPGCNPRWIPCRPGDLPAREAAAPAPASALRSDDGSCRCPNGSVITTHLPCRMVCPKR